MAILTGVTQRTSVAPALLLEDAFHFLITPPPNALSLNRLAADRRRRRLERLLV